MCAVALAAAACTISTSPAVSSTTPAVTSTTPPVSAAYGEECESFTVDPEHAFFAINDTYTDPDPVEWETAAPGDVGLDEAVLEEAAANAALSGDIASLLVVRDGKLVFERYFNGSDASQANNVHSLSKSILSLLTGLAIDDGTLELDSTIGELLPSELVGEHGDLTVENLLTMSGGLELSEQDEAHYEWERSDEPGEPSFVRAVLERPSVTPPGSEFAYSTGLTQVLAAAVTEATGQSLCTFAAERLFGPLGIDVEKWWVETGGYFSGGHSLFLTPREVARVGQLVLQNGVWEDQQLVPSAWLEESLAERWDLGCLRFQPVHQGYGYLWWRYDRGGHEVWNASGFGGQALFIVDDLDLLLVLTHDTSDVEEGGHQQVSGPALLRHYLLDEPAEKGASTCESQTFGVHTIKPDGTGRSQISGWPVGAGPSSWSPDGSSLAVAMDGRDLNSEIYVLATDGTLKRRLTHDFAFDAMPAWSPDGSSLAFMRGGPAQSDLYRVNADGTDLVQLTDFEGYEHSPTWSPDGTRIAFVWGHEDARGFGESGQLWMVGVDGSDPTLLLDESIGYPAWSPDGQHIALEIRGDVTRIGVLDLSGGVVVDLGGGYVPKWSPDGAWLAFVADRGGNLDLFVMDADGNNEVQLTQDEAFDTFPIWSPDGDTILLMSRDDR